MARGKRADHARISDALLEQQKAEAEQSAADGDVRSQEEQPPLPLSLRPSKRELP